MTARPDADAALALLRAEFPEPWKVNLWPLTVLSGRWSADALIVGEWEGSAELRAQGPTPLSAASALIAAWRAATRPQAERWRECAEALAEALDERGEHEWSCARGDFRGGRPRAEDGGYEFNFHGHWYESKPVDRTPKCDCEIGPALARFDAMDKEGVFAGVRAEVQRKYDAAVSHVPVADANAAILRLQKRLDAVRPVVAAAEALRRYHKGEPPEFFVKLRARLAAYDAAVLALPAADREWVTKGE